MPSNITIATVGDMTTHGGRIITGSLTRFVAKRPVARLGDKVMCPQHGMTVIAMVGNIMPQTDMRPTAHSGAICACGAKIMISTHTDNQGPS